MFEQIRELEFPQFNSGVFADYGGSIPLCQSQISRIEEYLCDIGNQYEVCESFQRSNNEIMQFKKDLLSMYCVTDNEYSVFFYSNTTSAIRSLAYAFPWSEKSSFIYQADNHNSILGIRKIALDFKAELLGVGSFPKKTGESHSMFAFPLQSNFSGKKYPKSWINMYESMKKPYSHAFVDAAAFSPTCKLDLNENPCSFIVISLLKCFGSNGGALLVRNDCVPLLNNLFVPPINFVSILSAKEGFRVRQSLEKSLSIPLSIHVHRLAEDFYNRVKNLKHENDKPVFEMYQHEFKSVEEQGGVVTFNLRNIHGGPVAHDGVFTSAIANSILIRFGVHCNPGATYMALGWEPDLIRQATKTHEASCSLTASIMEGKHVGTIRVSFGYASTQNDVDTLVSFFCSHFVDKIRPKVTNNRSYRLTEAYIHPIRGAKGINVFSDPSITSWKFTASGLLYDENWAVADEMSSLLDRRKCPKLANLITEMKEGQLIIQDPNGKTLSISLNDPPRGTDFTSSTVCHEKIQGSIYSPEVNQWFTEVLGRKAVLIRINQNEMKPFRALFTASLKEIGCNQIEILRPHFVFESEIPFEEDSWPPSDRKLGDLEFRAVKKLPHSTEMMVNTEGMEEIIEPIRVNCLIHNREGKPECGLELTAKFKPSRKNPKELVPNSELQ